MSAPSAVLQATISNLGGLQNIIDAMTRHEQDATVQLAGCWALACVTLKNQQVQTDATKIGAINGVLQAMETHAEIAVVQEAGCWALKELTVRNDSIFLWSACVQAVSRAMRQHPIE